MVSRLDQQHRAPARPVDTSEAGALVGKLKNLTHDADGADGAGAARAADSAYVAPTATPYVALAFPKAVPFPIGRLSCG